jgi:hypothetical protein
MHKSISTQSTLPPEKTGNTWGNKLTFLFMPVSKQLDQQCSGFKANWPVL